jgi:hypothetical protein
MANSSDNNPTPKSDERNLVAAAAASGANFEDQLALIWEKNQKLIIYSIVGIFVVFGIYQLSLYMSASAKISVQESYASADDSASKLAFAEDEVGEPLSGFAFKQLGDEAYEAYEYGKAAGYYEDAASSAKDAIKEAALMGQAMALLQEGQSAKAQDILRTIASNDNAGNLAEARYRLATLAVEEENFDAARTYLEDLQANITQENFYWLQKAMVLQSRIPAEAEAVVAE